MMAWSPSCTWFPFSRLRFDPVVRTGMLITENAEDIQALGSHRLR
jgi:hypothetical protein